MKMRQARAARFVAGLAGVGCISVALATMCAAIPTVCAAADASSQIQAAQRQFNAGNYSGAIATLQTAVSQNPNSAEAYYWLGRSYYEIRDYDSAITAAEKSVAIDDKNSVYHQWLGTIYGGKADRDRSFSYARKVKKEFEEAVELNP
jgi:tetratricopeptide (TPR) repeat protein